MKTKRQLTAIKKRIHNHWTVKIQAISPKLSKAKTKLFADVATDQWMELINDK
jgi:hypothetical protein|tara:strand:+ start:248 stop:406 length:159 start_codon:yes stop_codon:yes gene_type:complete